MVSLFTRVHRSDSFQFFKADIAEVSTFDLPDTNGRFVVTVVSMFNVATYTEQFDECEKNKGDAHKMQNFRLEIFFGGDK